MTKTELIRKSIKSFDFSPPMHSVEIAISEQWSWKVAWYLKKKQMKRTTILWTHCEFHYFHIQAVVISSRLENIPVDAGPWVAAAAGATVSVIAADTLDMSPPLRNLIMGIWGLTAWKKYENNKWKNWSNSRRREKLKLLTFKTGDRFNSPPPCFGLDSKSLVFISAMGSILIGGVVLGISRGGSGILVPIRGSVVILGFDSLVSWIILLATISIVSVFVSIFDVFLTSEMFSLVPWGIGLEVLDSSTGGVDFTGFKGSSLSDRGFCPIIPLRAWMK